MQASQKSTQKAYLETESGERLVCLFNPATLTIAVANEWKDQGTPGKGEPSVTFAATTPGAFDLELLFDTTETGDPVTKHTDRLSKLMKVDPSLPGHDPQRNRGRPPWVRFHWGDLHSFKAVISSLSLTYTFFASNGQPLRARATLSLKQYEADGAWGPQNPTSNTPDPHRVHQVQVGETLDRIAARYFGRSTEWRDIAVANGVLDPSRLTPGMLLVIPHAPAAVAT